LFATSSRTCWDLLQTGSCMLLSINTAFFRQIVTQTKMFKEYTYLCS
jgi:hypothetical protein